MGPPDTTDVGRPNSLNLRNDSSAMMAGNLTSTSRKPTKTLEDEVKELRLVNEELERLKAARALEDELQQLRHRNQELTRQMTHVEQSEEIGERTSHEQNSVGIGNVFSTNV